MLPGKPCKWSDGGLLNDRFLDERKGKAQQHALPTLAPTPHSVADAFELALTVHGNLRRS
jgi:hypothetical protein